MNGDREKAAAILPAGPVVKICGLTRVEDVLAAYGAGAWALGFIFAPSPRKVTATQVGLLLDEAGARIRDTATHGAQLSRQDAGEAPVSPGVCAPLAVGVFGEVGAEEVAAVVRSAGLDAVQLHGTSSPLPDSVREALHGWTPPLKLAAQPVGLGETVYPPCREHGPLIIKAVGVGPEEDDVDAVRRGLLEVVVQGALPLIDTKVAGRMGGTGRSVSWPLVAEAARGLRFLLAGGVGPANVLEALSVSGAWGVDVSSGVESAPGKKDPATMMDLMAEVKKEARARGRERVHVGDISGRAQEGSRQ